MTNMRATRVSGMVFYKHKYITNPDVTPDDAAIVAAKKLAEALKGIHTNSLGTETIDDLARLSSVFTKVAASAPP